MVAPLITGFYAGILGLFFFALTANVSARRGKLGISLHDGGDAGLNLAIRRHANFAEVVPLALLLIALLEMNGGPDLGIHVLGLALTLVRLVHPFGINAENPMKFFRFCGGFGTGMVTVAAAGWLIVLFLAG